MPTSRTATLLAAVVACGGTSPGERPIERAGPTNTAPREAVRSEGAHRLEFVIVDDGSSYMNDLFRHVGLDRADGGATEPAARALGIAADIDQWRADDDNARLRTDPYLFAHDRTERVSDDDARKLGCPKADACEITGEHVLRQYLDNLARRDPAFTVPSDRRIVFERVTPRRGTSDQRISTRTYYVEQRATLTGAAIADARVTYEPATNRPIVQLDFDRAGAAAFGELTARIIGKKLATLLDGKVRSAPVIMSEIRGGRVSISMGGSDPEAAQREAEALARVLRPSP